MLQDLEKKNRATKIYRFTSLRLSVLCTCPSEDSAAPPDPDAAIMIHLFGDATSLLRSRSRHYSFTETLSGLGDQFQGDRVKFEDHYVPDCQLIFIADNITTTAKRFQDHKFPINHACIVIWSGSDFSWLSDEEKDKHAQNDSYLEDKVSVLAGELSVSNERSWSSVDPLSSMVRGHHGSGSWCARELYLICWT